MGNIKAIIGSKLQLLRELAGWTQEQMASNMGGVVGKEQIGRYERLGIRPKEEVLEAYAKALYLEPCYVNQLISGIDLIPEGISVTLQGLQVGSRIWKLRAGRNVFELAEKAELFPEHWLRYELGQGPPSLEVCDRVASVLGCNTQDILQKIPPGHSIEEAFGASDHQYINVEKATRNKLSKPIDDFQTAHLQDLMALMCQFIDKMGKIDGQLTEYRREIRDLRSQLKGKR